MIISRRATCSTIQKLWDSTTDPVAKAIITAIAAPTIIGRGTVVGMMDYGIQLPLLRLVP
jgi:hypothetical protein